MSHFNPAERRDPAGKWSAGGAILQRMVNEVQASAPKYHEGDTPVPSDTARALDKWTQAGGHMQVSPEERKLIARTVKGYGGQVPAGLVRGESEQPPSRYAYGKVIRLSPASFSTSEESALPYAESGSHSPTILHLDAAGHEVPGLNVSGRAADVNGFYEREHILAGQFKVTGSRVDSEGIRHVTIVPNKRGG